MLYGLDRAWKERHRGLAACVVVGADARCEFIVGHADSRERVLHDALSCPCEVGPSTAGALGILPEADANLVQVRRMTDANWALVEWSLTFKCTISSDLERWKRYFENSIPVWLASLKSHLDARAGVCLKNGDA